MKINLANYAGKERYCVTSTEATEGEMAEEHRLYYLGTNWPPSHVTHMRPDVAAASSPITITIDHHASSLCQMQVRCAPRPVYP